MPENIQALLKDLKTGLRRIYRQRLRGVYLFGSYARGEQDSESDLDILIILNQLDGYGVEIERTGELVSNLSLQYGISISRVFMGEQEYHSSDSPLLRNVRTEALAV